MELETHFFIANRLSYITETQLQSVLNKAAELGRMLAGLISKLKARREDPDT
jgi:four helix bundle protein